MLIVSIDGFKTLQIRFQVKKYTKWQAMTQLNVGKPRLNVTKLMRIDEMNEKPIML